MGRCRSMATSWKHRTISIFFHPRIGAESGQLRRWIMSPSSLIVWRSFRSGEDHKSSKLFSRSCTCVLELQQRKTAILSEINTEHLAVIHHSLAMAYLFLRLHRKPCFGKRVLRLIDGQQIFARQRWWWLISIDVWILWIDSWLRAWVVLRGFKWIKRSSFQLVCCF